MTSWAMTSTNVRDGVYQSRLLDEPSPTITSVARSYRWHTGTLHVETPGQKGGDMRKPGIVAGSPLPCVMMGPLHTDSPEAPMTQSALDLFAGAGGWSLACKRLGIDEVGVENMPAALLTRSAAGFKSHDVTDVWDIDYADLRGQYDGLIASPPCQTFSAAGKGAGRKALDDVLSWIRLGLFKDLGHMRDLVSSEGFDDRTALVLTPLHAAWEMRPEWIAWEQVPTVLPVWEACAEELRSWGYSVWTGNLQAEMYGVPQTRKRAILIAHRDREVAPPTPTHSRYYARDKARLDEGVLPWVSMAEALGWGLVPRPSYTVCGVSANAIGDREWGGASVRRALAEAATSGDPSLWQPADEGGCGHDESYIDADGTCAHADCHRGGVRMRSNYGTGGDASKRGERAEAEPAPTVTSEVDRNQWIHERPSTTIVGTFKPEIVAAPGYRTTVSRQNAEGSVRVTVQEAGVLQSFPADFPWQGARTKQYLQCGNAVPPGLAEAVLRTVL